MGAATCAFSLPATPGPAARAAAVRSHSRLESIGIGGGIRNVSYSSDVPFVSRVTVEHLVCIERTRPRSGVALLMGDMQKRNLADVAARDDGSSGDYALPGLPEISWRDEDEFWRD